MTHAARSPRAVMIGRLHQLKAQAQLSDDVYRDKLELVTGKRSAAELSEAELTKAIQSFHVKPSAAHPHTRMTRALWIACYNLGLLDDGSDTALDAFVKRQTGKQALAFLTPGEANKVTEGLKDMAKRAGFIVPARDQGGMQARKALLRAQYAILAERGETEDSEALLLAASIETTGDTSLDPAQLDRVARQLGAHIRRAKASA